jgi:tetratricopeptide (TPR) repeat protein
VSRSNASASALQRLFELYRCGEHRQVSELLEPLLDQHPGDARLYGLHGAVCAELGDYSAAAASYREALALDPDSAKLHNGLGVACLRLRRFRAAAEHFRRAIACQGVFAPAHFNLGILLEHSEDWAAAAEHYRRAAELDANHVQARVSLGAVLRAQGDVAGALESLRAALDLQPGYLPAWRGLLECLEQGNRHDALRQAVADADRQLAGHALVTLYRGIVLDIDGDAVAARRCLEAVRIDSADESSAHHEHKRLARLVGVCDKLGDEDAAMSYAAAANRLARQLDANNGINAATFQRFVANRHRLLLRDAGAFAARAAEPAAVAPIFVVGFPRSGTTLLDTLLRGHPGLDVVEESPGVAQMVSALQGPADEHLEILGEAAPGRILAARDAYFNALGRNGIGHTGVPLLVDRFALNIIYAGEISRVFPAARFVLVLRHPADCVLSCYQRAFRASSANANFHALDDTAALYDRVFALWSAYAERLELNVTSVRYEDLVTDTELTCRALLAGLDVSWNDGVLDHQSQARQRPVIGTASYAQVIEPIHDQAVERWRRYRRHLQPVFGALEPWTTHFGYRL